jgi:hypothetical protein
MPRWIRIVLVSVIVFSLPVITHAQEGSQTYVVTGSQPINARACPQLACAVVHTFDPGTVLAVSAVVQGDPLAGNDQWLQVAADGSTVYVHSTLAEVVPPPPTPGPITRSIVIDTAAWVEHTATGFALATPPGWIDADDLFANDLLLESIAQLYAMDSDDFIQNVELTPETMDLSLIDLESGTICEVWHEDRGNGRLSPALLKEMLTFQFEQQGHTVTAADPVVLPAGEAVRLDMTRELRLGMISMDLEHVVYGVVIADQIYYLGFTVPPDIDDEDIRVTLDDIAASFRVDSP